MTCFLDALHCQNDGRPPVWIMRQAGRYLPEYRALRGKYRFLDMIRQPEIAAEVTLMPIRRFEMDAAIIFSDILTVADAFGCDFDFQEGVGPVFEKPLSPDDVQDLTAVNLVNYVGRAIEIVKTELTVPLLGFCGAPFTVASYMAGGIMQAKKWMFRDPASFHKLLDKIASVSIEYLKMQVKAGIDAFQIFESWSNTLAYNQLKEFSFPYMKRIIDASDVPVILFGKGTAGFVGDLVALRPQALSFDWSCDLSDVRKFVPKDMALQGNLDPHVLYGSPELIRRECGILLSKMKSDRGFIFNLGHGILPDISPESVQVLVDCVKEKAVL